MSRPSVGLFRVHSTHAVAWGHSRRVAQQPAATGGGPPPVMAAGTHRRGQIQSQWPGDPGQRGSSTDSRSIEAIPARHGHCNAMAMNIESLRRLTSKLADFTLRVLRSIVWPKVD